MFLRFYCGVFWVFGGDSVLFSCFGYYSICILVFLILSYCGVLVFVFLCFGDYIVVF